MKLPNIPLEVSMGGFALATILAVTVVHQPFWYVLAVFGILGLIVASWFKAVDEAAKIAPAAAAIAPPVQCKGKPLETLTPMEIAMMTNAERSAALDDWKQRGSP